MPNFKITDPTSGRTITMTGDTPPSEQDIQQAFAATPTQAQPYAQGLTGTTQKAADFLRTIGLGALSDAGATVAGVVQGGIGKSNPFITPQEFQNVKQAGQGNTLKDALNLAPYLIPFGEGPNIATKALLPGAVSGGLSATAQPNASPATVGEGALAGAATAGPLHIAGKLVGSLGRGVTDGTNSLANAFSLSQYKVPAAESMKLGLGQAVQKLHAYGLNDINAIKDVIPQVTGQNGLITQMTHAAVEQSDPVQLSGFKDFVQKSVLPNEAILDDSVKKNVLAGVDNLLKTTAHTKDAMRSDPEKIFKAIQQYQGLAKESANRNGEKSQALANVYNTISQELQDRLFMGHVNPDGSMARNGADDLLLSKVKTPEVLAKLEAINPAVAAEVDHAQNVRQLRSIAAPFVTASKAIERTQSATNNSPIKTSDYWLGAGALFNPHMLAILAGKKVMDSNAGKTMAADALHAAGSAMQHNNQRAKTVAPLLQQLLQVGATRGAGAVPSMLNPTN